MSEKCEQCGNKAEFEMVKHARKYKQPILCKGCDKYISEEFTGIKSKNQVSKK